MTMQSFFQNNNINTTKIKKSLLHFTLLFKTRQDKTIARQDKARQDENMDRTGQDKTRKDKTRQEHGQDRTKQDKTRQDRTGQNKTRQDKTGQDKTTLIKTCGCNIPSKLSISTGLLVMFGDMTINWMPSPSTLVPNNPLTVTRKAFACQYAMLDIKISYQI